MLIFVSMRFFFFQFRHFTCKMNTNQLRWSFVTIAVILHSVDSPWRSNREKEKNLFMNILILHELILFDFSLYNFALINSKRKEKKKNSFAEKGSKDMKK